MHGPLLSAATWLLTTALIAAPPLATPLAGQSSAHGRGPSPHALVLMEVGQSGLRGLLSASGNLGDLQNRAGSYRLAVQLERARVGPLEGRLAALDGALADPGLPAVEREILLDLRAATLADLRAVPSYEAAYRTGTAQLESLTPLGFLGERPLFLLARGRGHVRSDGERGLRVLSEGVSIAPVLVVSSRWIVAVGVGLGRADVDIGPFDGSSGSTSVGPRLDVGGILAEGWSVAVQLGHAWAHGRTTVLRPGPGEPVEVTSEGWSRSTSAKAELAGRLPVMEVGGRDVALRPRVGTFVTSTHAPATTNSLGETGTGPFGERESLAALRAGASLHVGGPWSPTLYAGWERELTDGTTALVDDPQAILAGAGVSWTWRPGRRVSLDYGLVRGLEGRRRVSELTLVVILDG